MLRRAFVAKIRGDIAQYRACVPQSSLHSQSCVCESGTHTKSLGNSNSAADAHQLQTEIATNIRPLPTQQQNLLAEVAVCASPTPPVGPQVAQFCGSSHQVQADEENYLRQVEFSALNRNYQHPNFRKSGLEEDWTHVTQLHGISHPTAAEIDRVAEIETAPHAFWARVLESTASASALTSSTVCLKRIPLR